MGIEVTTNPEETEIVAPPPVAVADAPDKPNGKKDAKETKEPKKEAKKDADAEDEVKSGSVVGMSPEMRELRRGEDRTIKDIIEAFGQHTSYKCRISRVDPKTYRDRATGKVYQTGGFLEWLEGTPIDEKWIQQRYGGGKYELFFKKRGGKGGWEYGGQVTVEIAGDPDLGALPGVEGQGGGGTVAASPAHQESPSIVTKALDMMGAQLEKAEARADRGNGGGDSVLVELMKEQLRVAREEKLELMKTIGELRDTLTKPPAPTVEDKVKDKLFDKLIDQDTARLTAQANKYESEIRQLRENALENERRLQDRAERDRQELRNAHERELSMLRQSHQNEITTLKTSQEISLSAARTSFETQTKILEATNKHLEKQNDRLEDELKELRAKKDKTIPEQVKEIHALKEMLGADDTEEGSTAEKIVEAITNPEAIAAVGSLFNKGAQAVAANEQQAAQQQQQAARKKHVVRDAAGNAFILKGNNLIPARKAPPPGTPPEVAQLPPMDPAEIKRVVEYLESACQAGTDPATVVQSFGAYIPDTIKGAVRDLGGVDAFLSKVAKLPSSSPLLANQAGRNWCKKLGKALAGE